MVIKCGVDFRALKLVLMTSENDGFNLYLDIFYPLILFHTKSRRINKL